VVFVFDMKILQMEMNITLLRLYSIARLKAPHNYHELGYSSLSFDLSKVFENDILHSARDR
jgi:hypothetical protein